MGFLVSALQIYTPEYVKQKALMQLFDSTAAAFEAKVPPISGLDWQASLALYARFTQTLAEQRLRDGREVEAVEQRLYRNAVAMGRPYGKWLRLGTVKDVMAMGRVLYRILATDFRGDARGE